MRYTFDDLCKPNFEYFEYHRAEQLEFDFLLSRGIFVALGEDAHLLAETVKAEEPRIHQSFQEHGRHLTSSLYRKLIRGFKIPRASEPVVASDYATALYENYRGLVEARYLTREHAEELEHYLANLFSFTGQKSPDSLNERTH